MKKFILFLLFTGILTACNTKEIQYLGEITMDSQQNIVQNATVDFVVQPESDFAKELSGKYPSLDLLEFQEQQEKNEYYFMGSLLNEGNAVAHTASICERNNIFYYKNYPGDKKLYSKKMNAKRANLIYDGAVGFLQSEGENIYFLTEEQFIYRYSPEEKHTELVIDVKNGVPIVYDNKIYVEQVEGLKCINPNNGMSETLLSYEETGINAVWYNLYNKYLFFVALDPQKNKSLNDACLMALHTESKQIYYVTENVYMPVILGDTLFFRNNAASSLMAYSFSKGTLLDYHCYSARPVSVGDKVYYWRSEREGMVIEETDLSTSPVTTHVIYNTNGEECTIDELHGTEHYLFWKETAGVVSTRIMYLKPETGEYGVWNEQDVR